MSSSVSLSPRSCIVEIRLEEEKEDPSLICQRNFEQIFPRVLQDYLMPEDHAKVSAVSKRWREMVQKIYETWEAKWASLKEPYVYFHRLLNSYRKIFPIGRIELFRLVYEATPRGSYYPFTLQNLEESEKSDFHNRKEIIEQMDRLADLGGPESGVAKFLQTLNRALPRGDQISQIQAWLAENPLEVCAAVQGEDLDHNLGYLDPPRISPEIVQCFDRKIRSAWRHEVDAVALKSVKRDRVWEIEGDQSYAELLTKAVANRRSALARYYLEQIRNGLNWDSFRPRELLEERRTALRKGLTQAIEQDDLMTVKQFLECVDYSISFKTLSRATRQARRLGHKEIEKELRPHLCQAVKGSITIVLAILLVIGGVSGMVLACIYGECDKSDHPD